MNRSNGRGLLHALGKLFVCATISCAVLVSASAAQENPDKLLWGDTHLHTNRSVDAYFLENRSADADTAYRFAKGEPVVHPYHRAELLIATTLYIDDVKNSDERLAPSRNAKSGTERLDAYIDAWGNYIPEIYGVAKALLAVEDADKDAATAWSGRMLAMRQGCEAAIKALNKDGMLSADHTVKQATDILWTMLSIRNWEQLTIDCGWPRKRYIATMKSMARQLFVTE